MSETPMTAHAASIRLAQYGERTKTWSTATYDSGAEKALHEIAVALDAEVKRLRAELAHAVPHAREKALKEAARLVENHVPDDVFGQLWNAADEANSAANAALDQQQGVAS